MEICKSRKDLILACYNRFRIQPTDAPRLVRLAKLYRLGELAMLLGEVETALKLNRIYRSCCGAWIRGCSKRFDPMATLLASVSPDSPWIQPIDVLAEFVLNHPDYLQPKAQVPAPPSH